MGEGKRETAIYTAFEDCEPVDIASPERDLLRAVLMAALSDARNKHGDAKGKAMQYLLSVEEDYLFSFRSICTYLNVDAEKILMVSGLVNNRESPEVEPVELDEEALNSILDRPSEQ